MNVNIRPVRPTDVADLHAIRTCPGVMNTMLRTPEVTLSDVARQMEELGDDDQHLVAEITSPDGSTLVVGEVKLLVANRRRRHAGTLDMTVHDNYTSLGIGKQLFAAALDLADNWLGLLRLELGAFVDNARGLHIYERAGFVREALMVAAAQRKGELVDLVELARLHPTMAHAVIDATAASGTEAAAKQRTRPRLTRGHVVIRAPRMDDLRDLHELRSHASVIWGTMQFPGLTQATLKHWLERELQGHPHHTIVAEVTLPDGARKVVGQCSLVVREGRMAHSGRLSMAVLDEFQGLGMGDQLMTAMLASADGALGLRRIDLDVYTDNLPGVALYAKHGFEVEGVRRLFAIRAGRYADALLMGRVR